ncbi:MAG: hypothetical protein PF590_09840 [Candidatus Delongbacteria bacterium]|jgi:hypothetical protein|nr:hypothetical protein [Candidatus Delongbacteria bacterium]
MECPNCHHKGNLLKRPFVKRRGLPDQYCVNCGAWVRVRYKWKNIFLLVLGVTVMLLVVQLVLQSLNYPGLNGGMAGGIAGATTVIFMRRPAFVSVELPDKKEPDNPDKK